MNALRTALLSALASSAFLAPTAAAHDGLQINLGKQGKHGFFGISYSTGRPTYCAPPVCAPPRVWVPAHYETRCERVWVEGPCQQVWIAPVYEWRHDAFGRAYQVCVCPGTWTTVRQPGHFELREVQIRIEGRWQ